MRFLYNFYVALERAWAIYSDETVQVYDHVRFELLNFYTQVNT